jgi:putative FmdB family regulatory protein
LSEDITFLISAMAGALTFQKSVGHFQQPGRWRRYFMPMYDYNCLDCGKESLVVLTLKEHESSKVKCPKCGSTKMQQLYSPFVAHTTKKS